MSYRFLTIILFVGMCVTTFIGSGLEVGYGSEVARAAMSPIYLLSWALSAGVYLLPLLRADPGSFTPRPVLLRRLFGFTMDFCVAHILISVPLTMLVLTIGYLERGVFDWYVELSEPASSWLQIFIHLSGAGLVVLLSLPLSLNRRSPGQVMLGYGLKLEQRLSLGQSCRRALVGFLSLCMLWLSGPIAARRDDRRMWHDRMYGVHPLEVRDAA